MLEVDPGVRVAPDENGEEQPGQCWGQQHDDQAEETAVADGNQSRIVRSAKEKKSFVINTQRNAKLKTTKIIFKEYKFKPDLINFFHKKKLQNPISSSYKNEGRVNDFVTTVLKP